MCESLQDLDTQISKKDGKLTLLYGEYPHILQSLLKSTKADLLVVNEDVTPFSRTRDEEIEAVCKSMKV